MDHRIGYGYGCAVHRPMRAASPAEPGRLAARMAGQGGLSGDPALVRRMASAPAGAGAASGAIALRRDLVATALGASSLSALIQIGATSGARLAGEGAASADVAIGRDVAATAGGAGAISAAPAIGPQLSATAEGAGDVNATAAIGRRVAASPRGAGSLAATPVVATGTAEDPDATAYLDAAGIVDPTHRARYSALVNALKASGAWGAFDRVHIAGPTASASLRDLKSPAKTASAVNAPAFTAWAGWASDGVSSFVDVGEAFGAGGRFTLNSAMVGAYVTAQIGVNAQAYCGTSGTATQNRARIDVGGGSGTPTFRINDGSSEALGPAQADRRGLRAAVRSGASAKHGYIAGSLTANLATPSSALPALNATIGRAATSYSTDRIGFYCNGGAITGAQVEAVRAAVLAYFQSAGTL